MVTLDAFVSSLLILCQAYLTFGILLGDLPEGLLYPILMRSMLICCQPSTPLFFIPPLSFNVPFSSLYYTSGLSKVVNKRADGGITALHMAALNGHAESVQLLLDLGARVTDVTVEDGTTIDLIGDIFLPSFSFHQ